MQEHHIENVLFDAEQIGRRVSELVDDMAHQYQSQNLVMIAILRGSFMFFADLVREVNRHGVHPRIDFTTLSSYGSGTESSGKVTIGRDATVDVAGADVILIDDILDTGRTLSFASTHFLSRGAHSVHSCVLLDKPSRRVVPITADYVGFEVDDVFVVGYGLDFDSYYRELPYIAEVTFTGEAIT